MAKVRKSLRWTASVYAVHSWSGLLFGWLLFVCCVTGTLVVYKFPMKAWANPAIVSTAAVDPLGPDRALALMRAHDPEAKVGLFAFPSDRYSIHSYTMEARGPDGRGFRFVVTPPSPSARWLRKHRSP